MINLRFIQKSKAAWLFTRSLKSRWRHPNYKRKDTLDNILCKYLHLDNVQLIRCGAGNLTAAAREQWNDGSNTLAIAPGEVVVYDRNTITNKALEEAGVKLNYIPGSELVRGRGGPRCMSMPLYREDL